MKCQTFDMMDKNGQFSGGKIVVCIIRKSYRWKSLNYGDKIHF